MNNNNSNHEAFVIFNETQGKFVSIEDTESKLTERLADAYFWPSQISAESYCEYWKECYAPDDTFSIKKIVVSV